MFPNVPEYEHQTQELPLKEGFIIFWAQDKFVLMQTTDFEENHRTTRNVYSMSNSNATEKNVYHAEQGMPTKVFSQRSQFHEYCARHSFSICERICWP